ncbi:DUF881 domain-containing protein [Plantactinospora sonchi]|uniref:DUF881 domain-containing protein n=1 Tax=Plantactinospora sonchi TaxID=1544735 RepID=A0ABU7RU70_9ACTN
MTERGGRAFTPDFLTELFRNPLDPGYAAAAEQRRRHEAAGRVVVGWRRSSVRMVSVLTLVALGFLLTVAYRQTVAAEPSRSEARAGLAAQIRQREAENAALTSQAERLRAEVTRQRDSALSGSAVARLRQLEAATGLGRVRGDGVVVRVADAPSNADAVTGAGGTNLGRVLDRDLQDIANALWSVGAEAISINGQRLTATSTIRAAGGAILVDFKPVIGPYEVSAIGPGQMGRRFEDSAAARLLRSVSEEYGMSFDFRGVDDLTLPAATEPQLRYATPAVEPTSPGPSSSGGGTSPSPSGGGR